MEHETFVPKRIDPTPVNKRPRDVITAADWNSMFNLIIPQGNNNTEELVSLNDYFFGTDDNGKIAEIDEAIDDRYTKTETNSLYVADVDFETTTGKFTYKSKDGVTLKVIDTALEKVVVNFTYDRTHRRLVLHHDTGIPDEYVDLADLVTEYDFVDSDDLHFSVDGHTITATLVPDLRQIKQDIIAIKAEVTAIKEAAITATEALKDAAEDAAEDAEQAKDDAVIAKVDAEQASDTARDYANTAENMADASEAKSLVSEGWAKGTQNGTPVGESSPYYHNNAEYFKNEAGAIVGGAYVTSVNGVAPEGGLPGPIEIETGRVATVSINGGTPVEPDENKNIDLTIEQSSISLKSGRLPIKFNSISTQSAEGTKELVCYGNGKFVIAGSTFGMTGSTFYSTDGLNWTKVEQTGSIVGTSWKDIAYGNNKFMLCTDSIYQSGGSAGGIATSTDGTSFSITSNTHKWNSVAYGDGKFVLISSDKTLGVTTDGVNVTLSTPFSGFDDNALQYITYDGDKFIITTDDNKLFTNQDNTLEAWARITPSISFNFNKIHVCNNTRFVLSTDDDNKIAYQIGSSINPWTEVQIGDSSIDTSFTSIVYAKDKYLVMNNSYAYISSDLINWNSVTLPENVTSSESITNVVYEQNKFVFASYNKNYMFAGTYSGLLEQDGKDVTDDIIDVTSTYKKIIVHPYSVTDSGFNLDNAVEMANLKEIDYDEIEVDLHNFDMRNIKYRKSGYYTYSGDTFKTYVQEITDDSNPIVNLIRFDPNLPVYRLSRTSVNLAKKTYVDTQDNAIKSVMPAQISLDLTNWSEAITGPTHNGDICYGNGVFIVLDNNKFYKSTDGKNWTLTFTASHDYSALCYSGSKFLAVGKANHWSVAMSSNGINWDEYNVLSSNKYTCACYGDGKFVIARESNSNQIAYSTTGLSWTNISIGATIEPYGICYGNGKFVLICHGGKIYYSTDAINWTASGETSRYWSSIAYGNGKFVANIQLSNTGVMYYSDDAATWHQYNLTKRGYYNVAFIGDKFVCGSYDNNYIAYSTDGTSWTEVETNIKIGQVCYGNNILVGHDGSTALSRYGSKMLYANNFVQLLPVEEQGKLTIGNTTYPIVISTTDAPQTGKIVFVVEE